MKSTFDDASYKNDGSPCWSAEIAKERGEDDYPGCSVSYWEMQNGKWRVVIDMIGETSRYSDDIDSEEDARLIATCLVLALEKMWP